MEVVVALARVFVRLSREMKSRVENERHVRGGWDCGGRIGKRCHNDELHRPSAGFYMNQNAPLCKPAFTRWGPRDDDPSR